MRESTNAPALLIEGNTFLGGRNGVWVGSRMGENTLPMDCTDPAYVDEPARRVVLDRAADKYFRSNRRPTIAETIKDRFRSVGVDVRISPTKWALMLQKLRKKEFDATILGWVSDWKSDPYQIWHGSQADVPESSNSIAYQNAEVDKLIEEWRPTAIVIGIPYNMDDSRQEMTDRAERFGRQLHGRFGLPVHAVDERLSSHEGEDRLREARKQGVGGEVLAYVW